MKDAEPYRVRNLTGYPIEIKSSISGPCNLAPGADLDLKWDFFKKSKKKYRDVADNATKAFFDVTIRKDMLNDDSTIM